MKRIYKMKFANLKKLTNSVCLITILNISHAFAGPGDEFMVIEQRQYQVRSKVGKVDMLTYDGKDFTVTQSGKSIKVHKHDLDKSLRGRTVKELSRLLANNGYLVLKRRGADIAIDAEQRLLGGSGNPGQIPPSHVDGARYEGMAQYYKKKAEEEKKAKETKNKNHGKK
jgi:hypothetical protein